MTYAHPNAIYGGDAPYGAGSAAESEDDEIPPCVCPGCGLTPNTDCQNDNCPMRENG